MIYRCVGFEELTTKVTVNSNEPTVSNVYLKQLNNELNEVEIEVKQNNMGWLIVQNGIQNKEEMRRQFDGYTCDLYIKGVETFDKKKRQKQETDETEPKDIFAEQKEEIRKKIEGDDRLNMVEINLTKHFEYPNKIKEIRTGYDKIGKPDQIYFQSTVSGDFR